MRILTLQNTILVSLLVAGAAATACSSSDAPRPPVGSTGGTDTGAGGTGTTPAAGTSSTVGGTGTTPQGGTGTVAGGSSSTGGSSTGGAAGPSVCDGIASRVLTTSAADAFIDDFEKANVNPTTMAADPTQASPAWYAFNDVMPTINSIQILRTPGGAPLTNPTAFSGHYAGTGAITPTMMGFGVGVEINVGVNKSIGQFCVDASVFQGVSFWAKAGSAATESISAGFVIPATNQLTNGGDCPDSTPALTAKCNNFPQKNLTLTTDWQQYTVDWAGLKAATGQSVVGGKIQQILWLAPTANWDFSLDEVAFYTGTAPTGAVAPPASGTGGAGAGGAGSGGSGGSQ
jgi:hypothetical protein